jgi:hypothetical protein
MDLNSLGTDTPGYLSQPCAHVGCGLWLCGLFFLIFGSGCSKNGLQPPIKWVGEGGIWRFPVTASSARLFALFCSEPGAWS